MNAADKDFTQTELDAFMDIAVQEAAKNKTLKEGGPFGCCVVSRKTREVVGRAHNQVLATNDPSAHAEIQAIRMACKHLNSHILKDCVLFTSAYCCPMCLSCVLWSRIDTVYFAADLSSAHDKGFDDQLFYDDLKKDSPTLVSLRKLPHPDAERVFFENSAHTY
ncbi:hypothetical protein GEMRC1_009143 [Eukaryota sp. GEM-RC1]